MVEPDVPQRRGKFPWIEIVVIAAVVLVMASLVVVVRRSHVGMSSQVRTRHNMKSLVTMLRATRDATGRWPPYSGKNFVLSLVATGQIDPRNVEDIDLLFSPGDALYATESIDLRRYVNLTPEALAAGGDHHDLTSYAGRRNADPEHAITAAEEQEGTILLCDDDDGPLHHPDGLVVGYSNGVVRFLEWEEFDMEKPDDPGRPEPFLGDEAVHDDLMKVSSR